MRTTERLERLLEDSDTGIWFQGVCGKGALAAQAWQVAQSLKVSETEAYYAMRELAHDLLPETPGGAEDIRDEILRRALDHLSEHNVPYVPLDIEEDIQASYEDDTLEEFRDVVRGWIRELAGARAA